MSLLAWLILYLSPAEPLLFSVSFFWLSRALSSEVTQGLLLEKCCTLGVGSVLDAVCDAAGPVRSSPGQLQTVSQSLTGLIRPHFHRRMCRIISHPGMPV